MHTAHLFLADDTNHLPTLILHMENVPIPDAATAEQVACMRRRLEAIPDVADVHVDEARRQLAITFAFAPPALADALHEVEVSGRNGWTSHPTATEGLWKRTPEPRPQAENFVG